MDEIDKMAKKMGGRGAFPDSTDEEKAEGAKAAAHKSAMKAKGDWPTSENADSVTMTPDEKVVQKDFEKEAKRLNIDDKPTRA